jgi:hypothetical protein
LEQAKKTRQLQEKIKNRDINSMLKDPEFQKEMEEMRKKLGGF